MIKNNIKLEHLDSYAKRLSTKQMNMLYESKMNKKYKNRLFEDTDFLMESEDDDDEYTVYMSEFVLMMNDLTAEEALEFAVPGVDAEIDDENGVLFSTVYDKAYIDLLDELRIYAEDIRETVHPDFQEYL